MEDFLERFTISFLVFVFVCVIGGMVSVIFLNGIGATSGQHTGVITAVESNNNLLWDADLIYFKTNAESTQEDKYCINKDIYTKAQELAQSRKQVTIYYKNDLFLWKWECNGGVSIVYGIA